MEVKEISEIDDVYNFIKSNKICVVNASAKWCGPCRHVFPFYQGLAYEKSHIAFSKVDLDELNPQDMVDKVEGVNTRIESLPTYLVFQDGQEVAAYVGTKQFHDFIAHINSL